MNNVLFLLIFLNKMLKLTNELCGLISESSALSILSVVQKQKRNPSSYSQIQYLMKILTSALDKRVKEDRPSKYCRLCRAKIRSLFREEKEKLHKVKKNRTENIRRMIKKDSGRQRSLRRDRCSEAKEDKNRQPENKLTLKNEVKCEPLLL